MAGSALTCAAELQTWDERLEHAHHRGIMSISLKQILDGLKLNGQRQSKLDLIFLKLLKAALIELWMYYKAKSTVL